MNLRHGLLQVLIVMYTNELMIPVTSNCIAFIKIAKSIKPRHMYATVLI